MENKHRENPPAQVEDIFIGSRESQLKKLDLMERELEKMRNEPPYYILQPRSPDKLDLHEESLKKIALKLDTLLADLLEAEVREYSYPEFASDETGAPRKSAVTPQRRGPEKQRRSPLEVLVMITLIAAVFLVGMTFGLWGSFFFGL